jgi:hypothetical protein
VKEVTPAGLVNIVNPEKVKNKYDNIKKDYRVYIEMKETMSGWSFDEETGAPIADPESLEEYFKAHPKAKKFEYGGPRNIEHLSVLFDGVLATGSKARGVAAVSTETTVIRELESSDDNLLRRATANHRKQGKAEQRDSGLTLLAGSIDRQTNASLRASATERAGALLWSAECEATDEDKAAAAIVLCDEKKAQMFLVAPVEKRSLLISTYVVLAGRL